ncbi:MAG: nitroreductase family protein [Gammaproteobacteria bacterium]|nr:nitroreductase family protein [Gammaproteobacteria bacterium]
MPVEAGQLHAILETAVAAPSAGDLQAYNITVITTDSDRLKLRQALLEGGEFATEAPVSLIFSADGKRSAKKFGERGERLYAGQDATIAAAYAQLAIVAAGMASTWVGAFDEERLRSALDLPEHLKPVAIICFGYPNELPEPSPRRPLNEVVSYLDD